MLIDWYLKLSQIFRDRIYEELMTPAKNEHEVDTEAFKGLHFKIITKCREAGAMQLAVILDLIKKGKT